MKQNASEEGTKRNGAASGNIYCFASSSIRRCSIEIVWGRVVVGRFTSG